MYSCLNSCQFFSSGFVRVLRFGASRPESCLWHEIKLGFRVSVCGSGLRVSGLEGLVSYI